MTTITPESILKRIANPFIQLKFLIDEKGENSFFYCAIIRGENDYAVMQKLTQDALSSAISNNREPTWDNFFDDAPDKTWIPTPLDMFHASYWGWKTFADGFSSASELENYAFALETVLTHHGIKGIQVIATSNVNSHAKTMAVRLLEVHDNIKITSKGIYTSISDGSYIFKIIIDSETASPSIVKSQRVNDKTYIKSITTLASTLLHDDDDSLHIHVNGQWPRPVQCRATGNSGWLSLLKYGQENACSGAYFLGFIFDGISNEVDKSNFSIVLESTVKEPKPALGSAVKGRGFAATAIVSNPYQGQLIRCAV